jgi:hypothetical protein
MAPKTRRILSLGVLWLTALGRLYHGVEITGIKLFVCEIIPSLSQV